MNSNPSPNSPEPQSPAPTGTPSGNLAEQYLAAQLEQSRSSLTRTRIVSVIAVAVVIGYVTFLVGSFKPYLQPKTAAALANTVLAEQAQAKGAEISAYLKQEVPAFIRRLPDLALEQLPQLRMTLESQVETDVAHYCRVTSVQLGKHLDDFLNAHKDKLKPLLTASKDEEAWKQIGEDLEKELLVYLEEKPEGGESLKEQFDQSLEALDHAASKLNRLATATDLTPEEKKQRRAIAILVHAARKKA